MAVNWEAFRAHINSTMAERGQWVGIFDRDWNPVMDIEDWESATWPGVFGDAGVMDMTLPGLLADGSRNPVVAYLLTSDLGNLSDPASMEGLFHSAVWVGVQRPGLPMRVYRVLDLQPEGGQDFPARMSISGPDLIEHLKHLPLWADPSNRSKIVQWQFSDTQNGSAEMVSRKLIGRNLIGYFQPSLLNTGGLLPGSFAFTDDYHMASRWSGFQPNLHRIVCSPIMSGAPSEFAVVSARWDNAWDLMKATWTAAGILPTAELWLPGDAQPFPAHTTLHLPTVILDFKPRSTATGVAGLFGQGWRRIERKISGDNITSVLDFADASVPSADGRNPWVIFDFPDAPQVNIRKSTDSTFLVGGKSPKGLNDLIEVGIRTVIASVVAAIPFIGGPAAELIKGGGDMLGRLAADKFLNINEFTDQRRKDWHGRSGYISIAKAGEANSVEALQKAWQAKTDTDGGLSIDFNVDDPYPYLPGRDFDLGDVVGVKAWGAIWAAYLSELTWHSAPGSKVGWSLKVGNLAHLGSVEELLSQNAEAVRAVVSRIATTVTN